MTGAALHIPSYRRHKPTGLAVVTLNGRDMYLGKWNTAASRAEYSRLVAEWMSNNGTVPTNHDLTVVELLVAYRNHAHRYYQKDGRTTNEVVNIDHAIRPLKRLYGRTQVSQFGPIALETIQNQMIVDGLARTVINARIGRIKRVFSWAVSKQLAPPSLVHGLDALQGFRRGRTEAVEAPPIVPVPEAVVDLTLPYLPQVVRDLVRLQLLLACRPGEICSMRPGDVDQSDEIWIYRPRSHKTQHWACQRTVFIGLKGQAILAPYLLRDAEKFCFSPTDSERQRKAAMRALRKSTVQPSQRNRSKSSPKRRPSDHYSKDSYNTAIRRACQKAGVEPWSANRLRHLAATTIRRQFSLEAARVVLGHTNVSTSEIYAERDQRLGVEVARQIG